MSAPTIARHLAPKVGEQGPVGRNRRSVAHSVHADARRLPPLRQPRVRRRRDRGFCILDLAPEAPWRCPENCASYAKTVIDPTFVQGSLAPRPVEDEPEEDPDAIADLLDDAEMIVDAAEPAALADIDGRRGRKWWQVWKRGGPDAGGDDWHLSSR